MNQSQYISQAVAGWILKQLDIETDMACEGLPVLDVGHFFACLASSKIFPQADFSIAMAGFGLPQSELENLARQAGLEHPRAFSDDLHVAAKWRNNRSSRPVSPIKTSHPWQALS